jgi:hypothetical protein
MKAAWCFTLVLLAGLLLGGATGAATLEEIKTCVEANLPLKTLRQHWTLVVADRSGSERTLELDFEWKRFEGDRSKFVTRVTSPPDMRGSAVLVIENKGRANDVFSYLPELGKIRRLTSRTLSGSAFSSDFSQEDLQYLRSLLGAEDQKILPDAEMDGRPVHVVEVRGQENSAYEGVVTYLDAERCVLVRAEMHRAGGKLVKVLRADPAKVVPRGEAFDTTEVRAEDVLRGTHSVLRVEDSEVDVPIRDKVFTQSGLERRGR